MKSVQLTPGKMNYSLSPGNSPALLFIHGNSSSSYFWSKQLSDPALQPFTLITPDLFGHGRSDHLITGYSTGSWADAIIQLIDSLSLKTVILIGHSMGGHIALRIAEKHTNVKGLVLLGTTPFSSAADISQAFHPSNVLASIFTEEIPEDFSEIEEAFFNQVDPAFQQIFRSTDPKIRSSLAKEATSVDFQNELEIINKLSYPVGLTVGSNDSLINQAYLHKITANNFWNHQLHTIPESKHYSHWDNPAYFNSFLLKYAEFQEV
ncbi:MAG: alpha/beta hydrolase [Saprospiraceae bacterium]|nr:alpha/beta hydrolase [Saprospiraceae bacterium]